MFDDNRQQVKDLRDTVNSQRFPRLHLAKIIEVCVERRVMHSSPQLTHALRLQRSFKDLGKPYLSQVGGTTRSTISKKLSPSITIGVRTNWLQTNRCNRNSLLQMILSERVQCGSGVCHTSRRSTKRRTRYSRLQRHGRLASSHPTTAQSTSCVRDSYRQNADSIFT